MPLENIYAILLYGDKMFENKNFNIKKIYSVAMIKPKETENRIIRYGNNIRQYELICKTSGEVVTHFGGKIYNIKPGMVYIIPKSNNADYYIERTVPGDCIDIFFDTDIPFISNLMLDTRRSRDMIDAFQQIYRLWITKPDGFYLKCMAAVYEILYKISLKDSSYFNKNKFIKIKPGLEYINNNLYGHIDYYKPSELCGISYTYFKNLFIENYGIPPVKYVNNMRLERSRELLLINSLSIGEIAEMCGFESCYYFSKKFKEKYNVSPSEYRKSASVRV